MIHFKVLLIQIPKWIKIKSVIIYSRLTPGGDLEHVANQFKEIIPHTLSLMLTIEYHGKIPVILGDGNQSVAMEYFTEQMQKKNSTMAMFHLKVQLQLEQFHTKDHPRTWAVDQNVLFGHLTI